jgi:hypothetical protein
MDWHQYRARLQALGEALKKDGRFRAVTEVYPPFTPTDFDDLTASVAEKGLPDFEIWPGFRDFYGVLDGFRLQWQYLREGPATKTGSAHVALLPAIYLPEDDPADSVKRMYSELRIFDLVGPDDQVALQLHPVPQPPDLVYFADSTHKYHQLALNFESYLETLLEARSMYRWQQFFVADPEFPISKAQASEFRESLIFLFPDADAARFIAPNEN